ncbi:MAG TPA: N-acetylmuramoyl-L-alanine amidase, partial [Acholeplasma sp.]
HDTANTDPNSGALSHSNYLKNLVKNNTPTYVSWHYTLDDQMLIQHIPDNEIAYHAGDGSTLPGQGSYLGGGNRNGIGVETAVSENYDLVRIWQRTAKFTSKKAVQYNLPQDHIRFHRDFSGKSCPNTLFHSNMEQYFQRYLSIEYRIAKEFSNAQISMVSNNPDILDNTGRIISIPQYSQTVSYTVTVTYGGQTQSRTFSTFVPGSIR